MSEYLVVDKVSGDVVLTFNSDEAVELDGFPIADYEYRLVDAVVSTTQTRYGGRRVLTKLEFRTLFPTATLKAIDKFETRFEQMDILTDEQKDDIRTSFKNYNAAEDVNLDDPQWVPGLGLYIMLGYLTSEEMEAILNG